MDRSEFVRMIGMQLIQKLKELEMENDDLDIEELLKHHASIRIIPMDAMIPAADEAVKRDKSKEVEQMMQMQNEILAFVSEELKKEKRPELLN